MLMLAQMPRDVVNDPLYTFIFFDLPADGLRSVVQGLITQQDF